MVGCYTGGLSSRSRYRISKELILGSQRMDGHRTRPRLDQHENYSGRRLLRYRNPHRGSQTLARKRSYGSAVETRHRQLPYYTQAPTAVASEIAILRSVSRKM